jgi:uncharacterized protein YcfL
MRKAFATLLVVFCSGCWGTSGTQTLALATKGPNGETVYSTRVEAANPRLARHIVIARVNEMEVGGLTKAEVTLQSLVHDTEAVQYRWVWFDSHGFEVNSSSQAWNPLLVYGYQTTAVQGVAPNPSAKSFKLHLRYQE